jgi:hypothetical protein
MSIIQTSTNTIYASFPVDPIYAKSNPRAPFWTKVKTQRNAARDCDAATV